MSEIDLDKKKLAIGAQQLLSNPILNKAFNEITEELITSIFTAKDGDRDKFSHYKTGIDFLVMKLRGYINEVEVEKHQEEKEKNSLTLL